MMPGFLVSTIRFHLFAGRATSSYMDVGVLQCQFCEKTYRTLGNLRVHMNDAHLNCGPYQCSMCDKMSRTKSGLRMHVLRHHRTHHQIDSTQSSHLNNIRIRPSQQQIDSAINEDIDVINSSLNRPNVKIRTGQQIDLLHSSSFNSMKISQLGSSFI